jgi:hypothetical protein
VAKVECLVCGKIFTVPADGSPVPPHKASGDEKLAGLDTCSGSGVDGLWVPDDGLDDM